MQAHETLESGWLVRRVVVDVQIGEALEALEHEVDELLECLLLLRTVGGPEGAEPRLIVLDRGDPE